MEALMNLNFRQSTRKAAAAVLRNTPFPGRYRAYRMVEHILGENPGRFVVPFAGGARLTVDGIVDSQFFYLGLHDWNVYRFLKRSAHAGDTVFDVGANIGVYTIPMALRVGEKGHVYAFEALKSNYEMLLENIALNKLTNVTAVFAAVTDSTGILEAPDLVRAGSIGNYSLASESQNRTAIPSWSLDDFALQKGIQRIHVMKIDIEGSEARAFKGARWLLSGGGVGAITFELNPYWLARMGSSVEEMWGLVESLGATPFLLTRFSRLNRIRKETILRWVSEAPALDGSWKLDLVLQFGDASTRALDVERTLLRQRTVSTLAKGRASSISASGLSQVHPRSKCR
jgi:FkbM family methyltransferase